MVASAEARVNIYEVRNVKQVERDPSFNLDFEERGSVHVVVDRQTGKQFASWRLEEPSAESFFKVISGFRFSPNARCTVGTLKDTRHRTVLFKDLEAWFQANGDPAYFTLHGPRNTYQWNLNGYGGSTVAVVSDSRIQTGRLVKLFNETNDGGKVFNEDARQQFDSQLDGILEQVRQQVQA